MDACQMVAAHIGRPSSNVLPAVSVLLSPEAIGI